MRAARPSTLAIAIATGLALPVAAAAGGAGPAPTLRLQGQHTNTADVRDLALTRDRAWAATEGGLAVHRRGDGRHLCTLTSGDGLPGNSTRVVAPLAKGQLFVGGDFGAVVLANPSAACSQALRVRPVQGTDGIEPFDPVFGLVHARGRVFALRHQTGLAPLGGLRGSHPRVGTGSSRFGLWRAAAATAQGAALGGLDGTLRWYTASGPGLTPEQSLALELPVLDLQAQGPHLVVATGESLLRVEHGRLRPLLERLPDAAPRALGATVLAPGAEERHRARLLVGTAAGAIYLLDDDQPSLLVSGLGGRVTALAADGERVWVGVGGAGLRLVDPERGGRARALRPRGEICSNHVTRITRHRGKLVAGSFDQGACVLEEGRWRALPGLPSPMVHGLASDGYNLYVATSNGISRFDDRLVPKEIGRRDSLALRWLARTAATGAVEVGPRQVALSSGHGLLRVWRKRNGRTRTRFTNHEDGVPFAVTSLAAAGREVFVGSEKEGVKAMGYSDLGARRFQDPVHLPENWVTALAAVGADDVWVATCQSGVAHLRGDQPTWTGEHHGLADDRVLALAADDRGAFVATLGGLSWIAADHATVQSYGLVEGLPDPRGAGLLLDGDQLWVSSEAGLARFEVSWSTTPRLAAATPSHQR